MWHVNHQKPECWVVTCPRATKIHPVDWHIRTRNLELLSLACWHLFFANDVILVWESHCSPSLHIWLLDMRWAISHWDKTRSEATPENKQPAFLYGWTNYVSLTGWHASPPQFRSPAWDRHRKQGLPSGRTTYLSSRTVFIVPSPLAGLFFNPVFFFLLYRRSDGLMSSLTSALLL